MHIKAMNDSHPALATSRLGGGLQYLSELLDAALVLDDATGVLGVLGAQGVILAPVALEAALQERVPVVVEFVLRLRLGELHAQVGGGVGGVQELWGEGRRVSVERGAESNRRDARYLQHTHTQIYTYTHTHRHIHIHTYTQTTSRILTRSLPSR